MQSPALTIVKSAFPTNYSTVGQTITYIYNVTNSGNVNITGNIMVTDSIFGQISIPNNDLGQVQSVTTTANYTIKQSDIDAGYVLNSAYATNNNIISKEVNVIVNAAQKAIPTITWSNPANITYGTALSNTQLDTTSSVPDDFVYTPQSGTVLNAGTHTLDVFFTPTDTANHTTASATTSINVTQVTPTITWNSPLT